MTRLPRGPTRLPTERPCANKEAMSNSKHVFALSGRTLKRNRSTEEEEERKRRDTYQSSTDSDISDTGLQKEVPKMEIDTKKLIEALTSEEVMKPLTTALSQNMQKAMTEIENQVKDLGEMCTAKFEEIEKQHYDSRLDEFEQRERINNIIITGMRENHTSKKDVVKLMLTKLDCMLNEKDIEYTLELKTNPTHPGTSKQKLRVRVALKDKTVKDQIMKKKVKLGEANQDIWVSDDLTLYRSRLAYMARQAVKKNKLAQTWTHDCKIFMKEKPDDRPRRVRRPEDIPQ